MNRVASPAMEIMVPFPFSKRSRSLLTLATACLLFAGGAGCARMVQFVAEREQYGERSRGITFYIGGAGPIGHVGSFDVPAGLGEGGYPGYVEVFTWQGMTHAGDQINLSRNREKAAELASLIRRYARSYPAQKINIIALSAGTGIAAFALEYLPESVRVNDVVFLGCSLSSVYDMTRALKRVGGRLYVIYSPNDRVLRDVVWYTGTVDRSDAAQGVAGMEGFRLPDAVQKDTRALYEKIRNIPYRAEFAEADYEGGHTGGTSREFVRQYLAPLMRGDPTLLIGAGGEVRGEGPAPLHTASQPSSRSGMPARRSGETERRPPGSGDPLRPYSSERR